MRCLVVMTRGSSFALVLAAASHLGGCTNDPAAPLDTRTPPTPATHYVLTTDLDVPAEAFLPQPGYDVLAALHALREDPGAAIFDLLDEAGVPLLADLKASLPSVLEDRVEDWIGAALTDVLDVPALDELIALAETTVGDVDMISELDLDGAAATHRVRALRFGADPSVVAGANLTVDVPIEALDPLLAFDATAPASIVAEGNDAFLELGDHAFGLPLGKYAWIALEQLTERKTGGTIRDALARAVDCQTAAHSVAQKGILGVEVGHETELRELCETGLDLVEAKLYERVASLDLNALRLAAGRARLVDADGDGDGESLVAGSWDASVDFGLGARAVTGQFSGVAVPE